MKPIPSRQYGFSLVEFLVGFAIALILSSATISIYFAQTQTYKTTTAQATIQNAENAIAALVMPVIREAGFTGCGTILQSNSSLNAGGSPPLGTLSTTPSIIMGYDGGGPNVAITQINSANDTNASDWSPSLDASLVGSVEKGSDVLIVLGAIPGSTPTGVTSITSGSSTFVVQNTSTPSITAGQYGAISDCIKTAVFQITGVAGTTITHATGSGALTNSSNALLVNFQNGAQFVPLQQTAFFVAQGHGGQSALMRAILNGPTWSIQELVPGVETMQVQYGIGNNGVLSQYVTANNVTNWAQVYSLRLSFLIAGQMASGSSNNTNPTQFSLLGFLITIPADNRLRHVYEMTINLRNMPS